VKVFGGENIGITLVQALAKAKYTIEILSYLLLAPRVISKKNNPLTLLEIFHKKISEGVSISIVLNDKFPSGWLKTREEEERRRLRQIGVKVKTYPRKTILHSKLLIIDRQTAYIGSLNLTSDGMNKNHEILLEITEKPAIERLSEIFYNAWTKNLIPPSRSPLNN